MENKKNHIVLFFLLYGFKKLYGIIIYNMFKPSISFAIVSVVFLQ